MKKRKILLITCSIIALSAIVTFAGKTSYVTKNTDKTQVQDTLKNNPKIDIKVNKEYDDNGNVIRYDSSYTYIYTHPSGKTEELNIDSIFGSFKPFMFNRGFDLMKDPFNRFFEEDTFYQRHFFDDDFFMQQFENEMFRFEEMMKEMDSLRNIFLREGFPEYRIIPKEDLNKEKTKGTEI